MKTFNYFVYIVKCIDSSYYTEITNDLERRLYEHNNSTNKSSYTFERGPVELANYESFKDVDQAIDFGKKIKRWTRKKKEALIQNNWIN